MLRLTQIEQEIAFKMQDVQNRLQSQLNQLDAISVERDELARCERMSLVDKPGREALASAQKDLDAVLRKKSSLN